MNQLLVNLAQLQAAASAMSAAKSIYDDAINNVRAAAGDLAGKWEGEGQVQFVRDQNSAYNWYTSLSACVAEMIQTERKFVENYRETEQELKRIVNS